MAAFYKFPVFILLLLALGSCKKQAEMLPDPPVEAAFSRKLTFPNQGNLVKDAQYQASSLTDSRAFLEEGLLYLYLDAQGQSKAGDGILLAIDASNLQTGPLKTYRFTGSNSLIRHARYTYFFSRSDGSTWGSITDSRIGVIFEGELVITAYDATRKLVSGTFSIKAPDLINDPTRESVGQPIDPVYYCTLELSGQFRHLKIQ